MPNTNSSIPQIPVPLAHIGSLYTVVVALKQAVEILAGFRGAAGARATTLDELTKETAPLVVQQAATSGTAKDAVKRSGDTMTGPLILSGAPTAPLGAATKGYVDNAPTGFRNWVINGDMRINQRGASSYTSVGYALDRWAFGFVNGTRTVTQAALADADRTAVGDEGCTYALQYAAVGGTATTDFDQLYQRVEGVHQLSGKTVTLSFKAKRTAGAGNLAIELTQVFGTGGSPSAAVTGIGAQQVSITGTAAKYSATIAIPSVAGTTVGTNGDDCLQVGIWLSAGSSFNARSGSLGNQTITAQIWDVQLEVGSASTPFERRPLAVELPLCRRYYQLGLLFISGSNTVGLAGGVGAPLSPPMRAAPAVTAVSDASSGYGARSLGGTAEFVYATATCSATGAASINVDFAAVMEL